MSELDGPLFKIQFRKIGDEKPLNLQDAETIDGTTLSACRQDLYELLSAGYEAWISNASGEPFNSSTEKYVIDYEAQNLLEDGCPLIIRRLHDSLVLQVSSNVEPFGIEAYAFFRDHVGKGDLLESFGVRTAKAFETTLRKKK